MIERGALVLECPTGGAGYRGLQRTPLDGMRFTGKRGRELALLYREALAHGDGAIDDLDVAADLCDRAMKLGVGTLEAVVFEGVFEEAETQAMRSLPMATPAPVEGLVLLGYDVCELIEPFCSVLVAGRVTAPRNAHGLVDDLRAAIKIARAQREIEPDEPVWAVRVWAATT